MANNHVELALEYEIPMWSTGFWGSKFSGATGGLLMDMLMEGAATGLGGQFIYPFAPTSFDRSFDQPLDALSLLGNDAMRPWYPGEDHNASLKPRLREKWTFWTGSPKDGIVEELVAAGFEAPTITVPGDYASPPDSFTTYWSRFWVTFAEGDHPITGAGTQIQAAVVGETQIGPEGLTATYYTRLKTVVRRMKPAQWVPWNFVFVLPGGTQQINLQGHRRFQDPDYTYLETP